MSIVNPRQVRDFARATGSIAILRSCGISDPEMGRLVQPSTAAEPIGNIPPAEAEDQYYAAADNIDMVAFPFHVHAKVRFLPEADAKALADAWGIQP